MCGGFIFECGRVGMDMTFLSYMHKRLHTRCLQVQIASGCHKECPHLPSECGYMRINPVRT